MNMASLLSNSAASTVENSINIKIKTSETTENPANTELESSPEPKPSASKESLVQQETAFYGTGGSCTDQGPLLNPKPSAIKGSLVQQETAFFGTGGSCTEQETSLKPKTISNKRIFGSERNCILWHRRILH